MAEQITGKNYKFNKLENNTIEAIPSGNINLPGAIEIVHVRNTFADSIPYKLLLHLDDVTKIDRNAMGYMASNGSKTLSSCAVVQNKSIIARYLINTYFAVTPFKNKNIRIFKTRQEALEWLEKQL